ncbi:ABC transporter substrate-binding protein [Magnetococcus sp. PR-3]|uniref:ABC transporter substrate-binding protein n=1 Tax=Magnetococcus sp. PR-3 TaxID=3120355 RepID=UPI002FCE46E2
MVIKLNKIGVWALLVAFIGLGGWLLPTSTIDQTDAKLVTIAVSPLSFASYTIFIAQERGYFAAEGLTVRLEHHPHGLSAMQALQAGEVDYASSSETPLIRHILKGAEFRILASMITANHHVGIVARRDRGITRSADLVGKRIGVTQGSNGAYYLDLCLLMHGLSSSSVTRVHLKPTEMKSALVAGEIDAASVWNPVKYALIKELNEGAFSTDLKGLYAPHFILSVHARHLQRNPDQVEAMMKAMLRAAEYVKEHRDQANVIAARYMKSTPELLHSLSATYDFTLKLDQSLISILEQQAHWIGNGLKVEKAQPIPNFLEYIAHQPLVSVAPDRVTVFGGH